MHTIDFTQDGGFPLEQNGLNFMQQSYIEIMQGMIASYGCDPAKKYIIRGVVKSGSSITSGWVVIDNEVMPFTGGTGSAIGISEQKTSVEFEDKNVHAVFSKKTAVISSSGTPLAQFIRIPTHVELQALINKYETPKGLISMWSGAINNIPAGWVLCNGANATPDLRNRFIVGAGSTYNIGVKGGVDKVTLTESQMPSHSHSGSTSFVGAHTHTGSTNTTGNHSHSGSTTTNGNHSHTGSTNTTGNHRHSGAASGEIKSDGKPKYRSGYGQGYTEYAGNHSHTVTTNATGSHSHTVTTSASGNHSHTVTTNLSGAHSHTVSTNNTGGGGSHENRPPYYALAFIMYKGF